MKKGLIAMVLTASILTSGIAVAAPIPRTAKDTLGGGNNIIQGKITDELTRKSISEVVVYSIQSRVQGVSNSKGVYQLIVPKTDFFQTLKIMKKGYQTRYASFPVYGNTTYNIVLTPKAMEPEVAISFEGPTSTTLPVNAKEVQFLNLAIVSNKDVEVRRLSVTISAIATTGNAGGLINTEATPNANYTDIKLVDLETGEILIWPQELYFNGSDTAQTLTFDTPSWNIEKNDTRHIGLTMDIANNAKLSGDQVWVTLEPVSTTYGIRDIETGKYVTKITPQSQIRGNTMTISANGSLVIANADTVITDKAVTAGTDGILAAKFKATATDEDFLIKKLNFEVTNLTRAATTAVEYAYLVYKDSTGTSKTSSKVSLTDGTGSIKLANFSNLDMYVPKDDTTITFEVYIDTNTEASGATNSGDRIRVSFDATDATDEFEAIGQGSGASITDSVTSSDADISNANGIALYKSVPIFVANTTKSGCPTNSTKPTNGTNNIYCFDMTANSSGPIDVTKLTLQVAMRGATVNTLYLYDYADQSTSLSTATGIYGGVFFKFNTPDTVEAGQTITYIVKGSVTMDASPPVSIATRILEDTSFVANTTAASVNGNVVWSDRSATSHSLTTPDWTNGYKLSGLPTEQVTMSL